MYCKDLKVGNLLKKILAFVITTTTIFSLYVTWLKWSTTCVSCSIGVLGLPVSQFKLAIIALIGSLVIAISYYISHRVHVFQYITLAISGISAAVASFLMILQIKSIICWPCIIEDVLFYLIFVLMCLEMSHRFIRE